MIKRTAEEWGRVAVGLPGFRWMTGMTRAKRDRGSLYAGLPERYKRRLQAEQAAEPRFNERRDHRFRDLVLGEDVDLEYPQIMCADTQNGTWYETDGEPDPDDPATAGCLLGMLGESLSHIVTVDAGYAICVLTESGCAVEMPGESTIGRACIAAAEALGRWPNGADVSPTSSTVKEQA